MEKNKTFKWALSQLKEGKKVRRPLWLEDSYWKMGDSQIILWADDTPAKVHIHQIEANNWEEYVVDMKIIIKDIQKDIDEIFGVCEWSSNACKCCKNWRDEVIKLKTKLNKDYGEFSI